MEYNNNMHIRRLVTVNIGQELGKEKSLCSPFSVDNPGDVTLEELAKWLGTSVVSLDRYLPENN